MGRPPEHSNQATKAKAAAYDTPGAKRLANIVLLGASGCCLLALFYFLYQYAWTGQREFTTRSGAVIYYALPAALAIFLSGTMKLKAVVRIPIAFFCLLLAVSAYGAELYWQLRPAKASMQAMLAAPAAEKKGIADRLSREFDVEIDTRGRQEVIEDLRRQGIEATPQLIVPPLAQEDRFYEEELAVLGSTVLPLAGKANTVVVVCNQTGEYFTYKSDEHGFNNPLGLWRPEEIDFLTLGNSGTLGYCVPRGAGFVDLMRKRIPRLLNLGMSGSGPLHLLGTIKEYARPLKPKSVLWFYSEETSVHELRIEKHSRLLLRYLEPDFTQDLINRQSLADQAVDLYLAKQSIHERNQQRVPEPGSGRLFSKALEVLKLSALRQEVGMVYGAETATPRKPSEAETAALASDVQLIRQIFAEANNAIKAWGGKFSVVYIPRRGRYFESEPEPLFREGEEVQSFLRELGVPVINIGPAIEGSGDPKSLFVFRSPSVYNEEGHRLIAKTVLDALKVN